MTRVPGDDPWRPEPLEDSFSNTQRGYEPEDSEFGAHYHRATVHRSSSGFNNGPLGCAHLFYSDRGYSSSIYDLDSPSPTEFWSSHSANQSSTALLTNSNTQFLSYQDGTSGISSWSPSGRADHVRYSGAAATEPAGHHWKSNNQPPAEQRFDFRSQAQSEVRLEFNGTTKGDEKSYATPQVDFNKASFTNDVHAGNCTGCHTSERLANTFSLTPDDRLTQHQSAIDEEICQTISVDRVSGILPECLQGHSVSAHATEYSGNPRSSSPKDPWPATSSISWSFPASTLGPVAESWTCSICGRVLATKGTKNRNRNKRRHHCPGTGPKYPCDICDKVFNRDDTRLLHLRKQHPETNLEPPRKRKTL